MWLSVASKKTRNSRKKTFRGHPSFQQVWGGATVQWWGPFAIAVWFTMANRTTCFLEILLSSFSIALEECCDYRWALPHFSLYMGSGDQNSGCQVHTTSTFIYWIISSGLVSQSFTCENVLWQCRLWFMKETKNGYIRNLIFQFLCV